jgi:hypothetical protein
MNKFLCRLAAVTVAALAPMTIMTIATPAVSAAEECPGGRTWDPVARKCDPPPPAPAWYQAAPPYAQSWAPAWVPPPPPTPPWAEALSLKPVWDPKQETWMWIYVR